MNLASGFIVLPRDIVSNSCKTNRAQVWLAAAPLFWLVAIWSQARKKLMSNTVVGVSFHPYPNPSTGNRLQSGTEGCLVGGRGRKLQ